MAAPYVKSGSRVQPQKIQRHTPEYVRFEYYDANDALVDPDLYTVTFKYEDGTVIVDHGAVSLLDKILTKESTGIYYYEVDLAADQDLGWMFAFPKGMLTSGEIFSIDQGIPILIIGEEAVADSENFCQVKNVEAKCGGRSFSEDTKPSASFVQELIDGISLDIWAYLRPSYTSITDSNDLIRLRNIVATGAAAQAELECPRPNYERADRYASWFKQWMKEIKNGTMALESTGTGAEAVTTLTGMVSGLGTDTSISDDDKGPMITRDDEW